MRISDWISDLCSSDLYNQHGYAYRVDGQLTRRCLALCHHAPADEGAEEAHGHVDEEYPSPMEIIGDVTAKDRSCDGRDQCSPGPDAKRRGSLAFRNDGDKQCLATRYHRTCNGSLANAKGDKRA